MQAEVKETMFTLLELPVPLRTRIVSHAQRDGRTIRPEILKLLEEALDAREKTTA